VAIDAKVPIHRQRLAASGVWRGLVMTAAPDVIFGYESLAKENTSEHHSMRNIKRS
jgi:hypothetical protein